MVLLVSHTTTCLTIPSLEASLPERSLKERYSKTIASHPIALELKPDNPVLMMLCL